MALSRQHIVIALLAVVALYLLYDTMNPTGESFCQGNECGVLETPPFMQPKYWMGRDGRQQWGDYYFSDEVQYPALPTITRYDPVGLTPAEMQRANLAGGCPTQVPPATPAPAPQEEQVKAIPLKLNCPQTMDHYWDFQPAEYPLLPNLQTTTWVKN